jgi:cytosine/creatinine deaminase
MIYDLIIKNAKLLPDDGNIYNIGIKNSLISTISCHDLSTANTKCINVNGNIVSEPFVDPQLHLCKTYTADLVGDKTVESYFSYNMLKSADGIEKASIAKNILIKYLKLQVNTIKISLCWLMILVILILEP